MILLCSTSLESTLDMPVTLPTEHRQRLPQVDVWETVRDLNKSWPGCETCSVEFLRSLREEAVQRVGQFKHRFVLGDAREVTTLQTSLQSKSFCFFFPSYEQRTAPRAAIRCS